MTEQEILRIIDCMASQYVPRWSFWLAYTCGLLAGFAFGAAFMMWRIQGCGQ